MHYETAYNVFRRAGEDDLHCAIPEDRPLPGFLGGERWTFSGKVTGADNAPRGFGARAAETASRINGFYVFHLLPVRQCY